MWIPTMLDWARVLGVQWEETVLRRVTEGFADGADGEDEFDAVVGLLAMIAVVSGVIPSGEPDDDVVAAVEGWILGRPCYLDVQMPDWFAHAFVSPHKPNTVTIISNYLPLEAPFGGPNFFEFGDDVVYDINIDQTGDGTPDITYRFQFSTVVLNPSTFLYNTGPIGSLDDPTWNRRQFYSVTRIQNGSSNVLASNLPCPPCNIGPASTPDYETLVAEAIHRIGGGRTVFAGQRLEGFYVDLGAIFDLVDLRPIQSLHFATMMPNAPGVNATNDFSVHSIAIRVPKSDLTISGSTPTDPTARSSVVGIWAAASRQQALIREHGTGTTTESGPWVQVSRLGNPLFNEVLVPMGGKDAWNALPPASDSGFQDGVKHPEVSALLPVLYPNAFPRLKALTKPRADLVAVFLTGIPSGIVSGFQNYTGPNLADELRLNLAIPPTKQNPNPLGVVGGDLAGWPNGRRVFDDVVTVELRALAGATYPLVDPDYKPDPAVTLVTDGLGPNSTRYLSRFPYLGTPQSGYQTAPLSTVS